MNRSANEHIDQNEKTTMKFQLGVLALNLTLSVLWAQGDETKGSISGILRTGMRFAIEVPLNNISANIVSAGRPLIDSARHIIKTKGIKGFYSGGSIELLYSTLWYPRMRLLQKGTDNVHSIAASITALEALTMPLYRMRTALMVEQRSTVQKHIVYILKTVYRGTLLRAAPTFLSWDAFLLTQAYSKQYMKESPLRSMALTTGTQMGIAFAMAPIYVVLINRQKLTEPCSLPFLQSLKHHYIHFGAPLYARTACFGAALLGMQAVLTVGAMHLDNVF